MLSYNDTDFLESNLTSDVQTQLSNLTILPNAKNDFSQILLTDRYPSLFQEDKLQINERNIRASVKDSKAFSHHPPTVSSVEKRKRNRQEKGRMTSSKLLSYQMFPKKKIH